MYVFDDVHAVSFNVFLKLLGIVETGLEPRYEIDYLVLNGIYSSRDIAVHEPVTSFESRYRFRVDHIDDAFCVRESHLAVQKGSFGIFALRRRSRAEIYERSQYFARESHSAVALKFYHIFACIGIGSLEVNGDAFIGDLPVLESTVIRLLGRGVVKIF